MLAYLNVASTDTQATLFRDDHAQEIILSLRGSTSLPDFLTDFTFFPVNYTGCAGCEAHVGFYTAWKSIAANARAAIDKAQAASPKYALVITGHSLGGALSQLAFAGLSDVGYKIKYGWSYGQPRDGNQAYADYIDRLSGSTDAHTGTFYRVTHANGTSPSPCSSLQTSLTPDRRRAAAAADVCRLPPLAHRVLGDGRHQRDAECQHHVPLPGPGEPGVQRRRRRAVYQRRAHLVPGHQLRHRLYLAALEMAVFSMHSPPRVRASFVPVLLSCLWTLLRA